MKTLMRTLREKKFEFFLLLLVMPWFWWLILNIKTYTHEWAKSPEYMNTKMMNLFSPSRMKYYEDLRWNVFKRTGNNILGKIFYNKGLVIFNEAFDYLAYLSPRYYFQAGDGSPLSSHRIEPIPLVFFIFWLLGLWDLINKRNIKLLFLWFFSAAPALVTGQRNNAFLLLTLIGNSLISIWGLQQFIERKKSSLLAVLIPVIFYGLWVCISMLVIS